MSASAAGSTSTLAEAELFCPFGSAVFDVPFTFCRICVPAATPAFTVTLMVNVTVVFPANEAMVPVMLPAAPTAGAAPPQPAGRVMEAKVVFAGVIINSSAVVAAVAPVFLKVIVYVITPPAATTLGETVSVTLRSCAWAAGAASRAARPSTRSAAPPIPSLRARAATPARSQWASRFAAWSATRALPTSPILRPLRSTDTTFPTIRPRLRESVPREASPRVRKFGEPRRSSTSRCALKPSSPCVNRMSPGRSPAGAAGLTSMLSPSPIAGAMLRPTARKRKERPLASKSSASAANSAEARRSVFASMVLDGPHGSRVGEKAKNMAGHLFHNVREQMQREFERRRAVIGHKAARQHFRRGAAAAERHEFVSGSVFEEVDLAERRRSSRSHAGFPVPGRAVDPQALRLAAQVARKIAPENDAIVAQHFGAGRGLPQSGRGALPRAGMAQKEQATPLRIRHAAGMQFDSGAPSQPVDHQHLVERVFERLERHAGIEVPARQQYAAAGELVADRGQFVGGGSERG